MFQLLQPIWLFVLAGVSVPIIIHLWNRRPGKTLKVGSIALVRENIVSYKKRIRLTELLLLLLRCLLLVCIAVALAGLLWQHPANNASRGWVLMDRQQLSVTYKRFKPQIDSLLKAGLEFHYFEDGFKKERIDKALLQTDSSRQPSSYRNVISALNQQVDTKLPVYVFTDNYLRHFSGNRLPVSLNLHWFTYTPDSSAMKSQRDTAAMWVTIFTRAYNDDARYCKAALEAIQQFSKRNIVIKTATAVTDIPGQQDWLFWLDDEMPAANKGTKNMLLYARGEVVKHASYILPAVEPSFAAVDLYRSIIEKDSAKLFFDARWQDGYGHPILSVQQQNNTAYYWLYTHIDPAWNDLPWSDNFPTILYQLLYKDHLSEVWSDTTDKTIIDPVQAMPGTISSKAPGIKPPIFVATKLAGLCWLMAFILFFAERSLSFYHLKKNTDG